MKIRRQHYVWRKYLEPWQDRDRLWCARNNFIFLTNPMNIGQERDFYTEDALTDNDIRFINAIIVNGMKSRVRIDLARSFILHNASFHGVVDELINDPRYDSQKLSDYKHNSGEHFQSQIESAGAASLKDLLDENFDFLNDEGRRADFGLFIAFQYFRTKKMRDSLTQSLSSILESHSETLNALSVGVSKEDLKRIVPVVNNILASGVWVSLTDELDEKGITLLKNTSDLEFVTADQPVINTLADYQDNKLISKLELFYPISTKLGVLISKKTDQFISKIKEVSKKEVDNYNFKIINASHEQVFARSSETLKKYFPYAKLK